MALFRYCGSTNCFCNNFDIWNFYCLLWKCRILGPLVGLCSDTSAIPSQCHNIRESLYSPCKQPTWTNSLFLPLQWWRRWASVGGSTAPSSGPKTATSAAASGAAAAATQATTGTPSTPSRRRLWCGIRWGQKDHLLIIWSFYQRWPWNLSQLLSNIKKYRVFESIKG